MTGRENAVPEENTSEYLPQLLQAQKCDPARLNLSKVSDREQ